MPLFIMKLLNRKYDPTTGFTDEAWYDEHSDKVTFRRLQDVEGTLNNNKEMYNMHTGKKASFQDVQGGAFHVARIPLVIIEKWMAEGFNWYQSSDAERRAKLNDRDNRKLLVRPGRL